MKILIGKFVTEMFFIQIQTRTYFSVRPKFRLLALNLNFHYNFLSTYVKSISSLKKICIVDINRTKVFKEEIYETPSHSPRGFRRLHDGTFNCRIMSRGKDSFKMLDLTLIKGTLELRYINVFNISVNRITLF